MDRLITLLRRLPRQITSRRLRALWIVLTIIALTGTLALHYVQSLSRSSLFVFTLTNVNIILAVLLLFLLARNLIKLYFERRYRIVGAGFRAKLTTTFIAFALVPTVLLFLLASGYLTNRIDYWFSIQAEAPLAASLEVAQAYYQHAQETTLAHAREVGRQLARDSALLAGPPATLTAFLRDTRREYGLLRLTVYSVTGRALGLSAARRLTAEPALPPATDLLQHAMNGRAGADVQPAESGDVIQAAAPIAGPSGPDGTGPLLGVVVAEALIPSALVGKMRDISNAFQDYEQLKTLSRPIKTNYLLSFLIITLVILFSATWFSLYVSRSITTPIQRLAEGTQAVARGNLDVRIAVKAQDEVGLLVDSFNKMTEDLRRASTELKDTNNELERRRHYIETVMQNIATGVIALDHDGRVTTFNESAARILRTEASAVLGRPASAVLAGLRLSPLEKLLEQMRTQGWTLREQEIHCEVAKSLLTLRCSVSILRDEAGQDLGAVIVFDDLTELLHAQKLAAWEEVARRIAHEIKNPLTPIQLSAERLKKKYLERDPGFERTFTEATDVIISEVTGLKALVDEFSRFARMPAPRLASHDLHEILGEIISLYRGAHKDIEMVVGLADALPPVRVDRDQIKRAAANLFQNAIDAMHGRGRLWVTTSRDQDRIRLEVADEGIGVPPEDLDKLFLPYFSKKRAGTGLGLAIVHRIVTDHNGHIRVAAREPKGTTIVIELPV